MREKNLLHLFLALNIGLAGAFVVYLFLSTNRQPKVVSTSFPKQAPAVAPAPTTNAPTTATHPPPAPAAPPVAAATNGPATAPADAAAAPPKITPAGRKFTWQDVESADYPGYLQNLRASGCPEEKVRYIVQADINELIAQRRLKEAVAHDPQWWRAEPDLMTVNVLQEKGRKLEEQRRDLIAKLLGPEAADAEKNEATFWSSVQLTGPVLGNLPAERHQTVQEICGKSMERHQAAFWSRANAGQPLNSVEMAQLREQTRADLRRVLNAEELEEFLLRYSHNAHRLRDELRGFDPTPEEFRRVFRVIDPLDHPMQLEYGGVEAMSEKQRERYERQRDAAIKEVLSPERYLAYLLTKDPLYRQAQMYAMQYGAPSRAVRPIYEMTKTVESKRQKIINDASLTPQQKSEALQAVSVEQQQHIQRIISEANGQR